MNKNITVHKCAGRSKTAHEVRRNTTQPIFGHWLRSIRTSRNMTQADLSIASNCPDSMISKIESGQYEPSFAFICALSDALDIDVDLIKEKCYARK